MLSAGLDVDEADHVLAHVEVPFVAFLEQTDGFQFFHHGDVRVGLGSELSFGSFYQFGLKPFIVIITSFVPVAEVKVFIIGLAVPFVGGTDVATVSNLPSLIADDGLLLTILIGHLELQQQSWRAETKHMIRAVPVGVSGVVAKGCVASTFKDDAHGVVALLEHLGHIVGVEIHALRVP